MPTTNNFSRCFSQRIIRSIIRLARNSLDRTNVRAIMKIWHPCGEGNLTEPRRLRHVERAGDAQEDSCALDEGRRQSWTGRFDHRSFSPRSRNEQERAVCSFPFQADLELATISEARKVFTSQVLAPATVGKEGIERLWILCDSWLAHIERRVFPGGYFFTGAFFECAERSGAAETEINAMARDWWNSLKGAVLKAQDRKEIDPAADARRVSFDLNGILMAAYWAFLVEKDPGIFGEGRIAVRAKLESLATTRIPASAFKSERRLERILKGKASTRKGEALSALRRLGGKKAPPGPLPPFKPSPREKEKRFRWSEKPYAEVM